MRKQLSIILLLGLALTGCVKQELDKPCPLVLNLNSTWWSPQTDQIPVRSSSGVLPLPEGTTLGVRVQDLSQTAASNYISYTAAADGSVAPTSASEMTVNQKHKYDLHLYSPFRSGATTQGTFFHGEDVMWVEALRNFKGNEAIISRTLIHKMSQAILEVAYASEVPQAFKDNYPLANATIEVTGFYDDCTMDLTTGIITPGATQNAKVVELGKAICFVPFVGGNLNLHLKLTLHGVDGTTKIYETDYTDLLDSGVSMLFTLTIDEDNLEDLVPITITGVVQPWVVGGNTDIDVI